MFYRKFIQGKKIKTSIGQSGPNDKNGPDTYHDCTEKHLDQRFYSEFKNKFLEVLDGK